MVAIVWGGFPSKMRDHLALPTHYPIFGSRLPQLHPRRTKKQHAIKQKIMLRLLVHPFLQFAFSGSILMYMFILGKSLLLLGRVESEENAQLESTNHKKMSFRGLIFQGNELNAVSKVMQEWRIHQK